MTKTRFALVLFSLLFLVLGFHAQTQEEDELKELMNQIRRDKFDLILPQIMREHNIDMWIQVLREKNPDPTKPNLGSDSGIFIFTDRGGNRIERAVFGHCSDLIQECGAYDIVARPDIKIPLTALPEYRMPFDFFYLSFLYFFLTALYSIDLNSFPSGSAINI